MGQIATRDLQPGRDRKNERGSGGGRRRTREARRIHGKLGNHDGSDAVDANAIGRHALICV